MTYTVVERTENRPTPHQFSTSEAALNFCRQLDGKFTIRNEKGETISLDDLKIIVAHAGLARAQTRIGDP